MSIYIHSGACLYTCKISNQFETPVFRTAEHNILSRIMISRDKDYMVPLHSLSTSGELNIGAQ